MMVRWYHLDEPNAPRLMRGHLLAPRLTLDRDGWVWVPRHLIALTPSAFERRGRATIRRRVQS